MAKSKKKIPDPTLVDFEALRPCSGRGDPADFPDDALILIITDGDCDVLTVRRRHAYLVPAGLSLPFRPRGPVFGFR